MAQIGSGRFCRFGARDHLFPKRAAQCRRAFPKPFVAILQMSVTCISWYRYTATLNLTPSKTLPKPCVLIGLPSNLRDPGSHGEVSILTDLGPKEGVFKK